MGVRAVPPARAGQSQPNSPPSVERTSLAGRVAAAVVACAVVVCTGLLVYRIHVQSVLPVSRAAHPLFPPGVSLKPEPRPVVGNLGGMPVTFPPGLVSNVEYEGDPEFGHARQGPVPKRTHFSNFVSLGFWVRYPDIRAMPTAEVEEDRRLHTIFNTPWVRVHLTAGADFGDGLFLERMFADRNAERALLGRLDERFHGLEVYTPISVDRSKRYLDPVRRTYGSDSSDRDVYVAFHPDGRVRTLIECSNRAHEAAPCKHFFYPSPGRLRLKVTASYRRGMLPHWEPIQRQVSELLFSFRASPTTN